MDEKISPETAERTRALCRQISVAHNLDEEIQRELCSHMEDKLLAYLSGGEKLTEENAFLLVQEHFGNPEEVKKMLENVHVEAVRAGVIRRIGVALAATLGIGVLLNAASYTIQFPAHLVFGVPQSNVWWPRYAFMVLNPVFLYVLLRRWRKREENGGNMWFQTIHPSILILIIGAFFVVDTIVPIGYNIIHYRLLGTMSSYMPGFLDHQVTVILANHSTVGLLMSFLFDRHISVNQIVFSWLLFSTLFVQCILWLWWCDAASRSFSARAAVVGAWIAFSFLIASYQPVIGFGHEVSGQVTTFINWRNDDVFKFPNYTMHTILFSVSALMLYIVAGRLLEKMKRIRNHEIE